MEEVNFQEKYGIISFVCLYLNKIYKMCGQILMGHHWKLQATQVTIDLSYKGNHSLSPKRGQGEVWLSSLLSTLVIKATLKDQSDDILTVISRHHGALKKLGGGGGLKTK